MKPHSPPFIGKLWPEKIRAKTSCQQSLVGNPLAGPFSTGVLWGVCHVSLSLGLPGGSGLKNPPANAETWVLSLGWEDPLENEMVAPSSILAWEIP